MARCKLLKEHFDKLRDILVNINHVECRILEDSIRDSLITELIEWYTENCGPLHTPEVLRKGWKGFEQMDDLELIEDWLETLQLDRQTFSDEEFFCIECATDIESAINLKLKLACNIF